MSLRLVSAITITQMPNQTFPDRANIYDLDFCHSVDIESTWKNLTTTAKVIMPRNIYLKVNGNLTNWAQQSAYAPIENNSNPPILMRGDRISIRLGYVYNPGSGFIETTNEEFNGFITKINPKMPMEIDCEDNMWLLKQAQCPNMVFPASSSIATYTDGDGKKQTVKTFDGGTWTAQSIITTLLQIPFVSATNPYLQSVLIPALAQIKVVNGEGTSLSIKTNVGDFRTQNETIAGVLMRLRKDYKLECFFRPQLDGNGSPINWNNLYCSGVVYYSSDYLNSDGTFNAVQYGFQQNIARSNLTYLRKDDVRLGIKAYSYSKYELNTTNSAGKNKTKNTRLEANVGDLDGDIRTMFFWPATNTDPDLNLSTLTGLANQMLQKLKYDGWRGDFTSFGLPYVQNGMAVSLYDSILKERQGIYLVKGTKIHFANDGNSPAFGRTMDLHLRIDPVTGLTQENFQNGL